MAFSVSAEIVHPTDRTRRKEISLLVNLGSTLCWIPKEVAESLELPRLGWREFRTANGDAIRRETVAALMELQGRLGATVVVLAGPDDVPAVGLVVLESLGLGFDEANSRLIPKDLLAMGSILACESFST